ncbi:Uma2 family endonuclease [Leptolyngbyaceae cyanobacterium CCMR0082]|uniref:Uma2 family endonuclease n=2 Tax=Adonisia turfae TaxID=2950184 RepID=A0A6M0SEV7_9CYAN|nr:Uma2 family endonuclease [Adonisia turfae]NEZ57784.1 Uma2 family endonuclease [Adonisia turfae CCMR0081]NEZ67038.1 Uma2 family endonuclease [Adonisia turfae CCMR0082]
MVAIKQSNYFSPEDYLEAEKSSLVKHEYHDGDVYAMAGASDEHVTIGINITSLLRSALRGSNCRTYGSDMKVQIDAVNHYYYPDVMVSCDQRDREFKYFKKYPTLIIEVLSESTEAKDRGKKFEHYRHLETLREYVLVSQAQQQVEVFRKNESGLWVLHPFGKDDEVKLMSVDIRFSMASLYEDVEFVATFND